MKTKNKFLLSVISSMILGQNVHALDRVLVHCEQINQLGQVEEIKVSETRFRDIVYQAKRCYLFNESKDCSHHPANYESSGVIERTAPGLTKNDFKNDDIHMRPIYYKMIELFSDPKSNISMMFNTSECTALEE